MISLIGPFDSGLAVGAEGAAEVTIDTPIIVKGRLNAVHIKYNIDWAAVTATGDVCVNGTFTGDTDWTKGLGWSIPVANKATAGVATATNLTAAVNPLTITNTYLVTYTVVRTAGSIRFGDGVNNGTTRAVSGTYAELFVAGAAEFHFEPQATFQGTIDNVIIYDVTSHYGTAVRIATKGTNYLPVNTLLTVDDSITDAVIRPRTVTHSTAGANLIADIIQEPWPVCDYLTIRLFETMAGNSINVWFLVDD